MVFKGLDDKFTVDFLFFWFFLKDAKDPANGVDVPVLLKFFEIWFLLVTIFSK